MRRRPNGPRRRLPRPMEPAHLRLMISRISILAEGRESPYSFYKAYFFTKKVLVCFGLGLAFSRRRVLVLY